MRRQTKAWTQVSAIQASATQAFTIVEILVAIMLLGVIITVVLAAFSGTFKLSGHTTAQSLATNRSQALMEEIRGEWQTTKNYTAACLQITAPTDITVSLQDEDASGTETGTAYTPTYATDCSTVADRSTVSPLRKVTLTANNKYGQDTRTSQLVLEIVQP